MNSAIRQNYIDNGAAQPKKAKKVAVSERPTLRLGDLAGIEYCLQEVRDMVERPLLSPHIYDQFGISPPRGILISGPSGCGKTMLANAIAGEYSLSLIQVSAGEIVSAVPGESESRLKKVFREAMDRKPSVVLIDELDSVVGRRDQGQREAERRVVAQLAMCMDELANAARDEFVIVIGITSKPDQVDPSLRRFGRFDHEIRMRIPDEEARRRILLTLTRKVRLDPQLDVSWIARNTPGYSGADLRGLVREAALETIRSGQTVCGAGDFAAGIKKVQPSGKREGFAVIPDVSWDDIGALRRVREDLRLLVVEPLAHPELFRRAGISSPAGLLLWGPPGCGKTLLAKAVANESHSNFISVKGPELLHKYVGESERAVRQVFERAKASRPCIVFFDELDSLCPRRSSEDSNYASRLVNQLLTEMDGLEERQQVYVMAATNRPDIIDPAVLRPGRLDKMIYVRLPDAGERHDILAKRTRETPLDTTVDLERIARHPRCEGLSGADLCGLVREASLLAVKELLECPERGEDVIVTGEHFTAALDLVFPSVSLRDREEYDRLNLEYTVRRR